MLRTSDVLYEAVMMDLWPSPGAVCDFGIDSQEIYNVYHHKIRHGDITKEQLAKASGDGPQLTKLLGIPIKTSWDDLPPED